MMQKLDIESEEVQAVIQNAVQAAFTEVVKLKSVSIAGHLAPVQKF